ncbi:MAG: FAD-dependent oxidoreductase [Phototrophicaceae bacterium]
MQAKVVIIGGGLSGLIATWQLSQAGVGVVLLEARNRFGGRAFTIQQDGADCDMGPSWFWEGQPLIDRLLTHFGISYYEQYSNGAVLIEDAHGTITQSPMRSPMFGSRRIAGGMSQLVNAIVAEIPASQRLLEHTVTGILRNGEGVQVDVTHPTGTVQIQAEQVAVAIPLRLASELNFSPNLPSDVHQILAQTPTWMAGHAKFFAVYDKAFWRENGLCGTAISRRGPLAEIHDASPHIGDIFSLFGFVGISAEHRLQIGRDSLIEMALNQLGALYGDAALNPKATYLQDWSTEDFTANQADRTAQTRHPNYGFKINLGDDWNGKLDFIVSETAPTNSGLVEGALEAGLAFAKKTIPLDSLPFSIDESITHTASMDWDWLLKD